MDVLHTNTQNQPTFLQSSQDVACTWYEDCHQSGKTTGIQMRQVSTVIKMISVTQQKMFSGKDYSSFSQHLRLTLTISGHKSNMRDIGTTQVLNGIEEKKPSLISRAWINLYKHAECTYEQRSEREISVSSNKRLWHAI